MNSIKKMLFVLAGLLVFVCFPVLAQEAKASSPTEPAVSVKADDQTEPTAKVENTQVNDVSEDSVVAEEPEITAPEDSTESEQIQEETKHPASVAEVFVDSNALNSKISIEVNDEVVSGPGNKVLAVVPTGSTFKVVTKPAEGSETMAVEMKMRDVSGQVISIAPESTENNVQSYQVPQNAEGVSGAVFFGNTADNNQEEARNFVAQATEESAEKLTIVDSEKKLLEEEQNDVASSAQKSPTTDENPVVSEASEIPETGMEDDLDLMSIYLTAILIASVTLWSRKKLENS